MTTVDLRALSTARGGSRELTAYLAMPSGGGPFASVVLVHEIFGLTDEMRAHADRIASWGYAVLAVDLFADGGVRRCLVSTMRAMQSGKGRAYTDIDTGMTYLKQLDSTTESVGIIGFCMGGAFALMSANTGFDAAAANYGQVPSEAQLQGACPIVGSYGARDITLKGAAAKLETRLDGLGVEHDIKEYSTASHAFLNSSLRDAPGPLRPLMRVAGFGPEPVAAADAWQRIEDFFAEHLQGDDHN